RPSTRTRVNCSPPCPARRHRRKRHEQGRLTMRCVLVSSKLDLRGYLGAPFMRAAESIEIVNHPHEGPATDIRLAVAWHPPDDAFERYPNLQAVCSIGAGVDNILACPSLRPDVDVIRVVDPAQAQMMSGFVAWHVIGHQRRF